MIDLGDALHDYLSDQAGLTALIGTALYKDRLPEGASLPAVTYQRISRTTPGVHQTAAGELEQSRFQFSAWATSRATCISIRGALYAALAGRPHGTMGDSDPVTVLRIEHQNDIERYETPSDGSDQGTFGISSDYMIWHRQTAPTFT